MLDFIKGRMQAKIKRRKGVILSCHDLNPNTNDIHTNSPVGEPSNPSTQQQHLINSK